MRYRHFGRTGFDVSEIGHGLWGMGGWSDKSDVDSLRALQSSVDLGCNFFDTAWAYGEGHSDSLLGRILGDNPGKRLYAASKVPPKNRKWPATAQYKLHDVFPLDHVVEHAEKIRTALGTDAIDVLQYHVWDDSWAGQDEFRDTIEELKSRGLIRAFGLSLNRWEPENGIAAIHTGLVDCVQVIYNIFDQAPEDRLFPVCRERNIGVIARVPLDEGSLGGRLTLNTRFPEGDWRAMYFGAENLKPTVERVERLKKVVAEYRDRGAAYPQSLPEMAFRFILSNPDVSTTIPGMRKDSHVRSNLATSDAGQLPPDLLNELRNHRWDRKPQKWSA